MVETKTIDFEKTFKIPFAAMKIIGSHPGVPRDRWCLIKSTMMHGANTTIFSLVIWNIYLNIKSNNFTEACRSGVFSVIFFAMTLQYIVLVVNKKTVIRITETMKADFAKEMPEDEMDIVFEFARKGQQVCTNWLILAILSGLLFPAKHIILELYTYVTDDWKLLEMYPLTYPAPIEENKKNPVIYAIIYIALVYYDFYGTMSYVSFPPLGPIFILHACGQLELVKKKAQALYVDSSPKETEEKLKDIVKHLISVYDFVKCINTTFILVYEFLMKMTAVLLPLTAYEVIGALNRGEFSIEFTSFLFCGILICGEPCYYSDLLMEKGSEVRLALYSCGWESRYDHGVRTSLVMTLLRTLQPIAIHTMYRNMCLDALTDLFRQSYAIFNVINAAW